MAGSPVPDSLPTCGRCAEIAQRHGFVSSMDAAQTLWRSFRGRRVGGLSDAAGSQFLPGKNLGAMGDGGPSRRTTQTSQKTASCNYGSQSRHIGTKLQGRTLDWTEIQAAILRLQAPGLDFDNVARRRGHTLVISQGAQGSTQAGREDLKRWLGGTCVAFDGGLLPAARADSKALTAAGIRHFGALPCGLSPSRRLRQRQLGPALPVGWLLQHEVS